MCGERNRVGAPVICVYAPDTRRQYYCFQCWDIISGRAEEDVPELAQDSAADAQMVGMLLGIKSMRKKDRIEDHGRLEMMTDGTAASELDIKVEMDSAFFVDNVPFKRYHLTGAELEAHKAGIRERLDVD